MVVQFCCEAKAHRIALELNKLLKDLGHDVHLVESDVAGCSFWDGTAKVVVAPSPLGFAMKTPVITAPDVFIGLDPTAIQSLAQKINDMLAS